MGCIFDTIAPHCNYSGQCSFLLLLLCFVFCFCNASYYSMSLPLCVPPLKATTCKLPPVAMRYLLQCHTLLHSLATNILATWQQLLHNFFKTTLTYCFCCFFQFNFNYVEVAAAPPVAALHKVGFFALHLWRQHIGSCSSQMFFVLLRFKRNKVFLLLPRRKLATSISG